MTAPDHGPIGGDLRSESDAHPASNAKAALRHHAQMLHDLAASFRGRGKLIVASFGEDPATGRKLSPKIQHFEIGEVDGMVRAIERLGQERHRNVYTPLSVFRHDLPAGKKGEEKDVVAGLGLVGDFDDADAAQYGARMPVRPNYVLETSAGRFQAFILFKTHTSPEQAKRLAVAQKGFARCDHGTADICHVWRVPGTLNWPNKKKLSQGRPAAPEAVRVVQAWRGSPTDVELLGTMLRTKIGKSAAGHARYGTASSLPSTRHELPGSLVKLLDTRLPEGERSEHVFHVIRCLVEH